MTVPPLPDRVLATIEASTAAMREIIGFETGGRAVLRCTAGFMTELVGDRPPADYYRNAYDDTVHEFMQLDDYDFVTHHASRVLFACWQEELASIA